MRYEHLNRQGDGRWNIVCEVADGKALIWCTPKTRKSGYRCVGTLQPLLFPGRRTHWVEFKPHDAISTRF
jgi:hypothetical protein